MKPNYDVVKRWVNEAQEAVSSDNTMVQVNSICTALFLFVNINKVHVFVSLTLKLPDQICYSPYCQPFNSYNASS